MSTSEKPLRIELPVKLAEVKVAFSIGALAFEGDLPAQHHRPARTVFVMLPTLLKGVPLSPEHWRSNALG